MQKNLASLLNQTIVRIEGMLSEDSIILPGAAVLARRLGVSHATVRRALRALSDQGKIRLKQGMRPAAWSARATPTDHAAAQRLCAALRDGIVDGTYPAGQSLPKFLLLQRVFRVSPLTIATAFRSLHEENLIHKSGNRWFAGPPRQSRSPQISAGRYHEQPVVLILARDESEINSFYETSFKSAFSHPFNTEMTRCGIGMTFAQVQEQAALKDLPSGYRDVEDLVGRLQNRFAGALVLCRPDEVPDLPEWINRLGTYGRPVALFDHADIGSHLTRRAFPRVKTYYRCHFDETHALQCALDALSALGHRAIGIPHYHSPAYAWIGRRIQRIKALAQNMPHPIEVVVTEQSEAFWSFEHTRYWHFVEALSRGANVPGQGLVHTPSTAAALIERTPSLSNLLSNPNVTAIVAPMDWMAREYYYWMRATNTPVPERISLISFDNMPEMHVFPISSVNPGFEQLAYLTAHIFVGDLRVRASREGNVSGRCMVVDRGSIGPAP